MCSLYWERNILQFLDSALKSRCVERSPSTGYWWWSRPPRGPVLFCFSCFRQFYSIACLHRNDGVGAWNKPPEFELEGLVFLGWVDLSIAEKNLWKTRLKNDRTIFLYSKIFFWFLKLANFRKIRKLVHLEKLEIHEFSKSTKIDKFSNN